MVRTENKQRLPDDHGTYVLILRCRKIQNTSIGKLGKVSLQPGFYLYVGSAQGPGGIKARVSRHRRRKKKLHWHIDYLRKHTALLETWYETGETSREHDWAATLASRHQIGHQRFGASDCRCPSHLFYTACKPSPDDINAQLQIKTFGIDLDC